MAIFNVSPLSKFQNLKVFSGDVGFISAVDPEERTLKVRFDHREVEYEALDLDELVLAYATTIHKAKGLHV